MTAFFQLLWAECTKLRVNGVFLVSAATLMVLGLIIPSFCGGALILLGDDICAADMLPWPWSVQEGTEVVGLFAVPIGVLLFASTVGAEYTGDTWKAVLPRRPGRLSFLVAKLLVSTTALVLAAVFSVVLRVIVSAALALVVGVPVTVPPDENNWSGWQYSLATPTPLLSAVDNGDLEVSVDGTLRIATAPLAPLPAPTETRTVELGAGLRAEVPVTLPATSEGSLPRTTLGEVAGLARSDGFRVSGGDRTVRMAAVVQAWSTLELLYPGWDEQVEDPEALFRTVVGQAAVGETGQAGIEALHTLLAALEDGHGTVKSPSTTADRQLPVLWDLVEDELVVVWVEPSESSGIQRGDIVRQIDGVDVAAVLAAKVARTPAGTPDSRRRVGANELRWGRLGETVQITVEQASGEGRTVALTHRLLFGALREARPEPVSELTPGIWYLDTTRMGQLEWDRALPKIEGAQGLVFDVRGHPTRFPRTFVRHLIDEPIYGDAMVVERTLAGQSQSPYVTRWYFEPRLPRLTENRVFLTDYRALSYGESVLGMVEEHELGTIVGGATAGTNGNMVKQQLVGDYWFMWTGMEIRNADGSPHNRVGVAPDHPVERTIAGVRAGRDEVLEAGLVVVGSTAP